MDAYTPTPRSRIKRLPKRAHYDRQTVHAVLDAAFIAHVGYVIDGQPYVTPTSFWREGEALYWHGSSASRMLRAQSVGLKVCLTVTHVDGLVMARSGFHHSINYRSVLAFGTAHKLEDGAAKLKALEAFVERVAPGRWAEIRPPNAQELKATTVMAMTIEDAVAKVRTGPPVDDEPDYALPVWAGVVPLTTVAGQAIADPRLKPATPLPDYLKAFTTADAVDDLLANYAAD
ncbi:MAG: pyridoxamine 5'-phosphate oxidase family protein [Proteobacteria bacterium]|nr:pyridoxamine 5'-phosphate oxidase family protein [Pseudomonadota bacterium]MBI3499729.1 pyridoxamine 5'-phosphate oxidase family protein [Pseudomonadota bacterium]